MLASPGAVCFEISDFGFKFELAHSSDWIGCRNFRIISHVETAHDRLKKLQTKMKFTAVKK